MTMADPNIRPCGCPIDPVMNSVRHSVKCADSFAKDAEIARLKAEIQDANGALDDASVRRNDADSIACGIETLAKQRDDLADLWSDIGDIFWPEREKDDGYSDTAIREAVNEMNSEIARLKAAIDETATALSCRPEVIATRAEAWVAQYDGAKQALRAEHELLLEVARVFECEIEDVASAAKAEIARLKAENERVTKQRDRLAIAYSRLVHETMLPDRPHAARSTLMDFGLRIVGGQVEEVK